MVTIEQNAIESKPITEPKLTRLAPWPRPSSVSVYFFFCMTNCGRLPAHALLVETGALNTAAFFSNHAAFVKFGLFASPVVEPRKQASAGNRTLDFHLNRRMLYHCAITIVFSCLPNFRLKRRVV